MRNLGGMGGGGSRRISVDVLGGRGGDVSGGIGVLGGIWGCTQEIGTT